MLQSVFMGIGLAMDASCVSMTNGLIEKNMRVMKIIAIALVFGIFQSLMPILGYFIGSYFSQYIDKFIPLIALIVLTILGGKMIIETLREKKHDVKVPEKKATEETEDQAPLADGTQADTALSETVKAEQPTQDTLAVEEITDNSADEVAAKEEPEVKPQTEDVRKIKVKEIIIQAIATSIDAFSVGVLFVAEKTSFAMISFALFGIITALLCVGATFIGKKFGGIFKDKAGIIGGVILILIGLKIFIEYMVQTY